MTEGKPKKVITVEVINELVNFEEGFKAYVGAEVYQVMKNENVTTVVIKLVKWQKEAP